LTFFLFLTFIILSAYTTAINTKTHSPSSMGNPGGGGGGTGGRGN
ncbi:MAG: hypothetical protein JKY44_09285, partial [Flavobacteriaceae bacterium]|nr:hypothetical protein [Flavobacteriaceae bacterium]